MHGMTFAQSRNRTRLGLLAAICLGAASGCSQNSVETGREALAGSDEELGGPIFGAVISDGGKPVENALVRLEGGGMVGAVTVFSDAAGKFRSPPLGPKLDVQAVTVHVRKAGLRATEAKVGADGTVTVELKAGNLADEVPASAWIRHWPDSVARRDLMLNCAGCHQFPDALRQATAQTIGQLPQNAREPAWRASFLSMRNVFPRIFPAAAHAAMPALDAAVLEKKGELARIWEDPYTSLLDVRLEDLGAPYLAQYMPTDFSTIDGYDDGAPWGVNRRTFWREYPVSDQGLLREGAMSQGRFWGVDYRQHTMVELDPTTGKQTAHRFPQDGPSNPHTINRDAQGNLWSTLMANDVVARYNPKGKEWKLYSTPRHGEALAHDFSLDYRHEVVTDKKNRIWMSLIGLNRIGSLNPETGEYHELEAPKVYGVSDFQASLYSVVMTNDKKYLWYSQLNGGVGSFNLETEKFEHYRWYHRGDGPHRITIGKDDTVWVPLTGAGQLLAIDGHSGQEIGRYDLPDRNSAPYHATFDARRNAVWVGTNNSDRWYRFDTANRSFTVYPLPRKGAFFRAIDLDPDTGRVWSSYGSYSTPGIGLHMIVELEPGDS